MAYSVSVGPRYEKLVEYLIAIGRYENRSEIFRTALRMLEQYEYSLGYIYKTEEFKVLMSSYARLNNLDREISFPSADSPQRIVDNISPELSAAAKKYIEQRMDGFAIADGESPPAEFDQKKQP